MIIAQLRDRHAIGNSQNGMPEFSGNDVTLTNTWLLTARHWLLPAVLSGSEA
jgi:hypothetical protein